MTTAWIERFEEGSSAPEELRQLAAHDALRLAARLDELPGLHLVDDRKRLRAHRRRVAPRELLDRHRLGKGDEVEALGLNREQAPVRQGREASHRRRDRRL